MDMRNVFSILLIGCFITFISCDDGQDVNSCIMKEAIVSYPGDNNILYKKVFTHDGLNYTEVREFTYHTSDKKYSETPDFITTLTYENGKITKEVRQDVKNNYFFQWTFSYTVDGPKTIVHIHNRTVINGVMENEGDFETNFFESPADGIYLSKSILGDLSLEEYENGNLVRVGNPSPSGSYFAYDTTWAFNSRYVYDDKPNVTTEYVLQEEINQVPNGGYCKNNVLQFIYTADNGQSQSLEQSFTINSQNRLEKYVYGGTERTVTITYSCN